MLIRLIKKFILFFYWTGRNLFTDCNVYNKSISIKSKIGKKVMIRNKTEISKISIGDYSYVSGPDSYIEDVVIGKYCSIARRVVIGVSGHNYNWVSTSPIITSKSYKIIEEDVKQPQKDIPVIGNDVWVGMNVTIMRGVVIGDGAVIAAGSIVTSDVMPYSIVGGIPAKHLKFRFTEQQIEELLKIKWWDWSEDKIIKNSSSFYSIEEFIRQHKVI